jgi:general nucleoside transport system permease protein
MTGEPAPERPTPIFLRLGRGFVLGTSPAPLAAALVALLSATAAGSLLMIVAGDSPLTVWRTMFARTYGDWYGIGQVIFRATPLVFTALAVSVPLRAGMFNIGGFGQLTAAAVACAVAGAALPAGTPGVVAMPIAILAAMAAGGAIGGATGALRAYRGAHEVIVAILFNAIVAGVGLWLGNEWLFVGEATRTAPVVEGARFTPLGITGSNASTSALFAIAVAAAIGLLQTRTLLGLRWRMIGAGPDAARAAGVDVARGQLTAMTTAGALAGLAGAHLVLGHKHAFEEGLGAGQGFLGVAVALLAQGRAAGIIVSALVFGTLAQGGIGVAEMVPKELVDVLQAAVVLAAAATLGRQRAR